MPVYEEYGLFDGEESFHFVDEVPYNSLPQITDNISITMSDMMFKLSIVPPPEMLDLHQKSMSMGWDRQRIQSDLDSLTPLFDEMTLGTIMLVHVHQETNKPGCPRIPASMERNFCDLEINRLAKMLLRLDGMKARTLTVSPLDIFSTQNHCVPIPSADGAGSLTADEEIFTNSTMLSLNGVFDVDLQSLQYNDWAQSLSSFQPTLVAGDAQTYLQPIRSSPSPFLTWGELSPPSTPGWSSSGSGSSFAPSPPASSTSDADSGSMTAPSPPPAIIVREASVPPPTTMSAAVIVTARRPNSTTRSHSPAPSRPQASGSHKRKAVITVTAVPLTAAIMAPKRSPPATPPQIKASRRRRTSSQPEAQIQIVDENAVASEEEADDEDAEYELDDEISAPGPVRNARTTGRTTGDWAPRRRSRKCECEFPECRVQKMSFSRAHDLKRHLETVHGHTKIFHCTLCHPNTTQAVLDQFAASWRKMSKDEKMGYFTRKDAHRRHMANVHNMKI